MPALRSHERQAQERRLAFAEFCRGFRRSQSGNLCRRYGTTILFVFRRRGEDCYAWSERQGEDVVYSPGSFRTERGALEALWWEVEGWE